MADATHDPTRLSWVASANGHAEFPIQNLPFGVFSTHGGKPRGGVAIGNSILDIGAALEAGLFSGAARDAAEAAAGPALNPLLALPATARRALRQRLSEILAAHSDARGNASRLLHDAAACTLHLPADVGDYTDFFAGIHHARKGGQISRPDSPLMPNYKYVPVAYHSRASSVRPSGEDVRRPNGQRKQPSETTPTFGPCRNLDYELELGVWIGHGNRQGDAIPIGRGGRTHRRLLSAERLVGARHSVVGIAATRAVPRKELPDFGLAVDHHAGGAGALPRGAARATRWRSRAAAASSRRG